MTNITKPLGERNRLVSKQEAKAMLERLDEEEKKRKPKQEKQQADDEKYEGKVVGSDDEKYEKQEMSEDEKELETQKREIEKDIIEKKVKIGKDKGQVFDSIEDLVCEVHPGAKYVVVGVIPGSSDYLYIHKKKIGDLNRYRCEECPEIGHNWEPDHDTGVLKDVRPRKAYECHTCGIVKGVVINKEKDDGLYAEYLCKVCGQQVGAGSEIYIE